MPCGHHRGMKMPPKHPPRDLFHRRLRMTVSLYRTRNLRDAVLSFRLATRCRSPAQGLCPAKREDSYGDKSGPKAGSRASSPGEQAAACDSQKLVSWAERATSTNPAVIKRAYDADSGVYTGCGGSRAILTGRIRSCCFSEHLTKP